MKIPCLIAVSGLLILPSAALPKTQEQISVATWNVEWFFDDDISDNHSDVSRKNSAPSPDQWRWKLNAVARVIAQMKPTILGLQEIENRSVLEQLTQLLKDQHGISYRIAYIQGWDKYTGQNVALIYRTGLVEFSRREQTTEMFRSGDYYNIHKHLFARFQWGHGKQREQLLIVNVHLRASAENRDVRIKQCRLIRKWIEDEIKSGGNVIVLGDINTEETSGKVRPGSDLAVLTGMETSSKVDDLIDVHLRLAPDYRESHLGGRQFDRILISSNLVDDQRKKRDLTFVQAGNFRDLVIVGNRDVDHFNSFYEIPKDQRDVSDHYPIMAVFEFR